MKLLRDTLVVLLVASLASPHLTWAAAPQHTPTSAPIVDIALYDGGVLAGRLVDTQGTPQANHEVVVRFAGQVVGKGMTDGQGHFVVRNLRGGVHEVEAGGVSEVYRLWAPRTAPPAAKRSALVVKSGTVVRGQSGYYGHDHGHHKSGMLWKATVIGSAGVIGGVIGYNIRDFDPAS